MTELFNSFDNILSQAAPKIASRLQPGLTSERIEAQIARYSWTLPQSAFDLYRWHNGLSGQPGKLNLVEKLLRVKGKWHGELSGRENEIHLQLGERLIIAKFLPLDYALAGHRHLKLGRCPIDLLPFAILNDGKSTIYCMMRLDPENPIVYCANGTKLPPLGVTESFLSTQPQFNRANDLITFLIAVFQDRLNSIAIDENNPLDCEIDPTQFDRLYQQYRR
ncbi:hypothetical protein C7B77_00405 [Chamaesiphon polymorphus CCALA 037]|uniref:SMI1/KNR4 family protein n=2 Tax=Chamaesiphon TaxID=217161 RepID=A0A2T1GNW6_9CYAN|nr:hypothetical protein C7B77_00405 [Chamaesiphon polymorphus CCALA 037]